MTKDYKMISKGEVITHGYKITLTHKKTGEVFIVYPDGRSETYPFGTPVTTGGMRGLILYLNAIKYINGITQGDKIIFPDINLVLNYTVNPSVIYLPDGSKCALSTFAENENCVYNWIINNNPDILAPLINGRPIPVTVDPKTYIGTNGVIYFVYNNGTVTTGSPQKIVVPSGGVSGLIQWLNVTNPSVIVIG